MGQEGVSADSLQPRRHRLYEDVFAIFLGTMLIALGLVLFTHGTLVTSGLAGLSLVIFYLTQWPFGWIFFVINLPFYVLAFWRMGWQFGLRTVIAVVIVSTLASLAPNWIDISAINPLFAAAAGGATMGLGMLSLFRHRTSVGGISILAFYLQERFNLRAGYLLLGFDFLVMALACFVLPWDRVLISLIGAGIVNLTVAVNHKPGRYLGFS